MQKKGFGFSRLLYPPAMLNAGHRRAVVAKDHVVEGGVVNLYLHILQHDRFQGPPRAVSSRAAVAVRDTTWRLMSA